MTTEVTAPWIMFGGGYGTDSGRRNQELIDARLHGHYDALFDEELRDRYKRSGIDAVFFVWSIVDPKEPARRYFRRRKPSSWGGQGEHGLHVEGDFPDEGLIGDELNVWLGNNVREVMRSWKHLKP
jgi:hypothetical protein